MDPLRTGERAYQVIGSYARVVPTVVFQGTDYPVVAPINGDLVVQQWMQTDHLASHEHYDASFANPSHIITASPPASHPYIERSWNDSAGHEVQEYCSEGCITRSIWETYMDRDALRFANLPPPPIHHVRKKGG